MKNTLLPILTVGMGGFCGAIARFVITGFVHRKVPSFLPAGTLCVNVLGCLLIGLLMGMVTEREWIPAAWRLFLVTGLLGSLTTFSTFGYETLSLIKEQQTIGAVSNVAANLVVGLLAVVLGHTLVVGFGG